MSKAETSVNESETRERSEAVFSPFSLTERTGSARKGVGRTAEHILWPLLVVLGLVPSVAKRRKSYYNGM